MYNLLYKYSQQPHSSTYRLTHTRLYAMACAAHMQEMYRSYAIHFQCILWIYSSHTLTGLLHIGRLLGGFDNLIDVQTSDVYAMGTRDLVWFTRTNECCAVW